MVEELRTQKGSFKTYSNETIECDGYLDGALNLTPLKIDQQLEKKLIANMKQIMVESKDSATQKTTK